VPPVHGEDRVPPPHTSQPPPERRTGPMAAQPRAPGAAASGQAIRQVTLSGLAGTFPLKPGTYTVGRGDVVNIRLDDREVSRTHAIVIVSATSVTVEDQKSANGTFINGEEVTTRSALRDGDKVMFGGLEFTVRIEAS
jgi:pSer/pThr/pTyr-binding forkhead associated (FHA) protein